MKSILYVLTATLSLICAALPATAFDPCSEQDRENYTPIAESQHTGLLFRVERCNTAPSYIFGTMHSDSAEVLRMAKPVIDIINTVSSAGFEFVQPPNANELTVKYMYLPATDGNTLTKIIGGKYYQRLTKELGKRGIVAGIANRLKPWAAGVLLQIPPPAGDGIVLDDRLQQLAERKGIEVYGLETMEEQLSLFDNLPHKHQVTMLIEALNKIEEVNEMNALLIEHYTSGDLNAINALGEQSINNTEDTALRKFFAYDLLVKRNVTMVRRAQKRLKQGGTLIAVGTLHLPGEQGMLSLLEGMGYFVFAEK